MSAGRHLRGVLDTNAVILLPRITDPTLLPVEPLITTVTLAELSVGPLVASTEEERAARQAHLQQAEAILTRCLLTLARPVHSAVSRHRFVVRDGSRLRVPTTR